MVKISMRYKHLDSVKVTESLLPQQTEQRFSLPLDQLYCDPGPSIALHPSQTELSLSLSLVGGRSHTGSSTETLFWMSLS